MSLDNLRSRSSRRVGRQMALLATTALTAFVPCVQHAGLCLQPGACRATEPVLSESKPTRRAALLSAGGLAAASALGPQSAFAAADEGEWAKHKGPFDDAFFSDFRAAKASPDFLFKFVEEGEGENPVNFQSVSMHYSGFLLDGTKFDSSYDRGTPFKFRVGKNKVRQLAPIRRPLGCRLAMFPRLCLRCHC